MLGLANQLIDYDRKTGAQRAYRLLNNSTIWAIHPLGTDQWLAGGRLGLWLVHSKTGVIGSFTGYNQFQELAQSHVLYIAPDRQGTFWICSGTGLYTVESGQRRYRPLLEWWQRGLFYLPADAYEHFYQDQNGIYWLGTANAGLIRWDRPQNKYRQFRRSEGLTNDNIHAIYPDRRGRTLAKQRPRYHAIQPARLTTRAYFTPGRR